MNKLLLVVVVMFSLTACTLSQQQRKSNGNGTSQSAQTATSDSSAKNANITQCRKDLEALKEYSPVSHLQFSMQFDELLEKTQMYLSTKKELDTEVNQLATPSYQQAIRDLCQQVKSRLTDSVVRKF